MARVPPYALMPNLPREEGMRLDGRRTTLCSEPNLSSALTIMTFRNKSSSVFEQNSAS